MSKRKVSLILVLETLIIGIISLGVGLLLGIFISQFLSIFVSKLFEVDMSNFKFIFSKVAFNKTIMYFGLIFLLVVVLNTITLSRYKLIDLITAERKNEQVKIRNKYVTIVSFILSLAFIGYAYYLLIVDNALVMMDERIWIMILSGSIGTFLLFFSLSGFLLKVFEHVKKIYYKDLNLFTLKQVNSKINTTVISTTVICLMLLLTIGLLSGSMSLARVFNTDLKENNLTDYTVKSFGSLGAVSDDSRVEMFENTNIGKFDTIINDDEFLKYSKEKVLLHRYVDEELTIKDIMKQKDIEKLQKEYGSAFALDYYVPIIKESEYQSFMELIGEKGVEIDSNEYLLLANIDFAVDAFEDHYEERIPITVANKQLVPATDKVEDQALENSASPGNDGIVVVSDELIEKLKISSITLVGNFVSSNDEEKIGNEFYDYLCWEAGTSFDYRTRISMEASSLGLKTMVTFLGLYLGITFAISSATVLAIGQLSESSDNKKRYKILKQIGADNSMINKALFTQIAITFAFPLIIALIHSYFGLKEINSLLVSIGNVDLTSNILVTTLFMIIVYGGYFMVTYLCSKNIIKND